MNRLIRLSDKGLTPMKRIFQACAPSNIAFVKYWGKQCHQTQTPANSSISMTLSKCVTYTQASMIDSNEHRIFHDGKELEPTHSFAKRILGYLRILQRELNTTGSLAINTHNTFPSDSGIASSASGFSALTLAAAAAWLQLSEFEDKRSPSGDLFSTLAHLSRLGSGSSIRSFFGGFVSWEKNENLAKQIFSPTHWKLFDTIAIISKDFKPISSSQGHSHAWTSPLFKTRLAGIDEKFILVKDAIAKRDMNRLGNLIEAEALELHSIMLTSTPKVSYLDEKTKDFISWIRKIRSKGINAYFTLDAGPNVHVICEESEKPCLLAAIKQDWNALSIVEDEIGLGPEIKENQKMHPAFM